MSSFEPEQYGKYFLHERIARGGMAELFRGKIVGAKGFEKLVAIKRILPHLADQEEFVKAFIDEARLAAFLQHANIVQIYDFGEMGDSYYLSMEYLSGVDFKTVLLKAKEKDQPLKLALSLFYILPQICLGLQYAHDLKDLSGTPLSIIHRDLGPQNIFITYDGGVKLIDFGIAKASSHDATTYAGSIKGKVAYMSPEQAKGEPLDHRSDLFALGVLLYELATGYRVYTGETHAILAKAGNCEFLPPEEVKQGLPASLYAIINKALQKEPHLRYQSAEQMRMDLELCSKELLTAPVTGKQLNTYMHNLFEREADVEKNAIKRASLADSTKDLTKNETETTKAPEDKTVSLASVKKDTRKSYGLALISVFFVVAIIGSVVFFNMSRIRQAVTEGKVTEFIRGSKDKVIAMLSSVMSDSELVPDAYEESPDPEKAARFFFETHIVDHDELPASDMERLHRHGDYMQNKHPDEALPLFQRLATQFPGVGEIHYRLGKLYYEEGKMGKAKENYLLATKLNPNLTEAFFNLGHLYLSDGNNEEAEKMFARVVALSPSYLDEALCNLAYTQKEQGLIPDAVKSLREALKVNKHNKVAAHMLQILTQKN